MGAFIAAWLVGEGIISYRSVKKNNAPPTPGALLISSGVFVLLGLLAESQRARPVAVTLAWGFNVAALLNLFPTPGENPILQHNIVPWPPGTAPNTVVIPDGKTSSSSSNAPNQGPASTIKPPSNGTVSA